MTASGIRWITPSISDITSVDNVLTCSVEGRRVSFDLSDRDGVKSSLAYVIRDSVGAGTTWLMSSLYDRVSRLDNVWHRLQNWGTRESARNWSLLRYALSIAIVVGGVFGTMALMPNLYLAIPFAITAFIAHIAMSVLNNRSYKGDFNPFTLIITGPFIPLREMNEDFPELTKLEKEFSDCKWDVEWDFENVVQWCKSVDVERVKQRLARNRETLVFTNEHLIGEEGQIDEESVIPDRDMERRARVIRALMTSEQIEENRAAMEGSADFLTHFDKVRAHFLGDGSASR